MRASIIGLFLAFSMGAMCLLALGSLSVPLKYLLFAIIGGSFAMAIRLALMVPSQETDILVKLLDKD